MTDPIRAHRALIFLVWLSLIAGLMLLCSPPARAAGAVDFGVLEKEIVKEVNLARINPGFYASWLRGTRPYYQGTQLKRPGEVAIRTKEGLTAVDEAIRSLQVQKPVGALDWSRGLSLAARDLVAPQGAAGEFGHKGPDGSMPSERIGRHGTWESIIGENVAYGQRTARDVVAAFIVDDGVPGRGHQKNLYNPAFHVMGVDCGPHSVYGTMCAITFAGGFHEKAVR
ncbi:MAG TPA: CAP domain-containing protein [Syntrophales bacterium]|nr:CAP domain-containing protein [Syntrophales bacterium]